MKSNKIESVQDFLTPKNLLSSKMKMKTSAKPKPNHSLIESQNSQPHNQTTNTWGSPSPRRERESYKKNQQNFHLENSDQFKKKEQKTIPHYQNDLQNSRNSYEGNKSQKKQNYQFIVPKENQRENSKYRPVMFTKSEFSEDAQEPESQKNAPKQYSIIESKRSYITPIKKNPEISQLQVKELIHKLVVVRDQIEGQIAQLKHVLDSTQSYLENIDTEYQKIKEKILHFTSQALDVSFNEYKNNLPNWSKYEDVETIGVSKLAEINLILEKYQSQFDTTQFNSTFQLQRKIDAYKVFSTDVKDAQQQCISKRPSISEEKIKKFENVIWELGKF